MEKTLFIESLKIIDGKFIHPDFHLRRMRNTQLEIFGKTVLPQLTHDLIPQEKSHGILKCRITYDQEIRQIDFDSYQPRSVHSLQLIDGSGLDYHLKYANRNELIALQQLKATCDEILIYQNNQITDTSYSNVVLYDGKDYITPTTYLLNGTKRQYLLQKGIIKEKDISLQDLPEFQCLYLINAMLDIEDQIKVDISNIKP